MVSVFVSISRMVCMWCLGHHDAVQLLTYTCMELCTCILYLLSFAIVCDNAGPKTIFDAEEDEDLLFT